MKNTFFIACIVLAVFSCSKQDITVSDEIALSTANNSSTSTLNNIIIPPDEGKKYASKFVQSKGIWEQYVKTQVKVAINTTVQHLLQVEPPLNFLKTKLINMLL